MKVLLLVPNLKISTGGVANIYKVTALHQYGDIRYFFVNSDQDLNQVATFTNLFFKYLLYSYKLLVNKYDLVHVNPSLNSKSFYRDGFFIRLAKAFRIPVLTFFHGWEDEFEQKIRSSVWKRNWFLKTFARSDKFMVLGQIFKQKLTALGVPVSKRFLIESTVADDHGIERLNLPLKVEDFDQTVVILFISRMVKEKGIYIAIDSFERALEKSNGRKMILLMAGSGPELETAKAYVDKKGIRNIKFLGYVTGDEKTDLLLKSHVLLFPTYYGEGLPCAVLECMLFGLTVISRKHAAIPDVVKDGTNGYLTNSMDPETFASMILRIASNKQTYKSMAFENHHYAKQNFISAIVRDRIIQIYETFEK